MYGSLPNFCPELDYVSQMCLLVYIGLGKSQKMTIRGFSTLRTLIIHQENKIDSRKILSRSNGNWHLYDLVQKVKGITLI